MLKFFLASLIVASGIIIGAFLGKIAKEELKPGRRYFFPLKIVLFSAVLLVTLIYYFNVNLLISLFVLLLFSALFAKKFQVVLMYLSFSIAYILSYVDSCLYAVISSFIFFAGFPIGSLIACDLRKEKRIFVNRKVLIPYFVFIGVVFLAYLLSVL